MTQSKAIKTEAALALIKTSGRYITAGIYSLQEELRREEPNRELVCLLCDYIASLDRIVAYFSILSEQAEGPVMKVTPAQAMVARTNIGTFKRLKSRLVNDYHVFVELN